MTGAHHRHPGEVYLQAQGVEDRHGKYKDPWQHEEDKVPGRLVAALNCVCPRRNGKDRSIDGTVIALVNVDGTKLGVEANFFYLGDVLYSGGSCDSATCITVRCCLVWPGESQGNFRLSSPPDTSHLIRCAARCMYRNSESLWQILYRTRHAALVQTVWAGHCEDIPNS